MKSVVIIQADEAQSAELAEHLIKSGAFRVVGEAHDGVDGLELIERTRPDAVVLDIVIPGMDGCHKRRAPCVLAAAIQIALTIMLTVRIAVL